MKLAISNIAWSPDQRDAAYAILQDHGVKGLEIAPGLLFSDHASPRDSDQDMCDAALHQAAAYGLDICSMQSLHFGVSNAVLFEDEAARRRLFDTTVDAMGLAQRLGIGNLVFGSPKNRVIPNDMSPVQAEAIWTAFFRALGDEAAARGTVLALETNPTIYDTNFMTTLGVTTEVIRKIDHPAIRLNLDLGAVISTGEIESVDDWIEDVLPLTNHVHLSVPWLNPLSEFAAEVKQFIFTLDQAGWEGWVSIEMRSAFEALPDTLDLCNAAIGQAS